jgi:hypothetical protein
LIALFLLEDFFSVSTFLADSFFALCLGVLASSFLVEALVADFLAEALLALSGFLGDSSMISTSESTTAGYSIG